MNSFVKSYDRVGPVSFVRCRQAKRIVLSLRPFKGIRVSLPWRCSFPAAEQFLLSRTDWIIANLHAVKTAENQLTALPGESLAIDIVAVTSRLADRLNFLSRKFSLPYTKISFRNQKTLWASCSHTNTISLNIQLCRLPDSLIDYVLLHELVHTRIKNHSSRFWKELSRLLINARDLDRELKSHHLKVLR